MLLDHLLVKATNWNAMLQENLERWRTTRPAVVVPAHAFGKALGALFTVLELFKGRV